MKKGLLCSLLAVALLVAVPVTTEAATAWFDFTPDPYTGGVSVTAEYGSATLSALLGATYRVDTDYALLILSIAPGYAGLFDASLETSTATTVLLNAVTPLTDYDYPLYISNVTLHPDLVTPYYSYGGDYWYQVGTIDAAASDEQGSYLAGNRIPFQIRVTGTPTNVIPEPASMVLLPLGLAVAALRKRK